jgi:hypothetical protein
MIIIVRGVRRSSRRLLLLTQVVVNSIRRKNFGWRGVLIELTDSVKKLFKETASQLKGAARRRFQAQIVMELGYGGQLLAQKELGWDRNTIRKGIKELTSGIICVDNMSAKGRYKAEEHLPSLLEDIKKLVDSQSQTDPSFKSQRLYTRLTASQVRKLLVEKFDYSNEQLPTEETIRVKLNNLGYRLKRVAKVLPQKKSQKLMQSLSN